MGHFNSNQLPFRSQAWGKIHVLHILPLHIDSQAPIDTIVEYVAR